MSELPIWIADPDGRRKLVSFGGAFREGGTMAVNGFGISFLLALTMVIIFLKFVRVFTPTPRTILTKPPRVANCRDEILQRPAMADANALDR